MFLAPTIDGIIFPLVAPEDAFAFAVDYKSGNQTAKVIFAIFNESDKNGGEALFKLRASEIGVLTWRPIDASPVNLYPTDQARKTPRGKRPFVAYDFVKVKGEWQLKEGANTDFFRAMAQPTADSRRAPDSMTVDLQTLLKQFVTTRKAKAAEIE